MSAIDDLIEFMRSLESDHLPDGWPAVRMHQITALISEIERLRQERDGLRADAARYRWLRHGDNDELVCVPWMLRNEKLDAAIDAAIAKEQGE